MEEKERYEWNSPYDSAVRDNKNNDIINAIERLNEQDKRIKELEEENKELNDYLETDEVTKREYYQKVDKIDRAKDREIKKLKDKIKELEDYAENTANLIDKLTEDSVFASTQLAISELEKLKENAWQSATDISQLVDYTELAKIIDNQINELKGKVEDE